MRQILDRVTVTGADDSVSPVTLGVLAEVFPNTEWGILVSEHKMLSVEDVPRFPSVDWLQRLHSEACRRELQLSMHLCGRWVRELCTGAWGGLINQLGPIMDKFQRVQLNFGSRPPTDPDVLAKSLLLLNGQFDEPKQYIFQLSEADDWLASFAYDDGLDVAVLYDRSGGTGRLPEEWGKPMAGIPTGYAGGLGPKNVIAQLNKIDKLVDDERIWIDAETNVRTADDKFDREIVAAFLERAASWVKA